MEGSDPLATELREFVTLSRRGQLNCFSALNPDCIPFAAAPVTNFTDTVGALY
jgi:hypothetical protein